jgi:hypothetical protein
VRNCDAFDVGNRQRTAGREQQPVGPDRDLSRAWLGKQADML